MKKATYYVKEIADTLKSDIKEDLLLAKEKICEINKTLENLANAVKDVMLDKARKEDLRPVYKLRIRLKEKLGKLEKHELHWWEEDSRVKRCLSSKWNWKRKRLRKKWQSRKFPNCRSIR